MAEELAVELQAAAEHAAADPSVMQDLITTQPVRSAWQKNAKSANVMLLGITLPHKQQKFFSSYTGSSTHYTMGVQKAARASARAHTSWKYGFLPFSQRSVVRTSSPGQTLLPARRRRRPQSYG